MARYVGVPRYLPTQSHVTQNFVVETQNFVVEKVGFFVVVFLLEKVGIIVLSQVQYRHGYELHYRDKMEFQ